MLRTKAMKKLVLFAVVFSLLLVFDTDAWWGRRRRRRRRIVRKVRRTYKMYKIYRKLKKFRKIWDGKQDNIDFETGEAVMVIRIIQ